MISDVNVKGSGIALKTREKLSYVGQRLYT
jgi:hypothetical protein